MPSLSYLQLKDRLITLRQRFLNFDIPLERTPSESELDSIACFKLLMHAEIEAFIEERVSFAVEQTIKSWQEGKQLNRCAFQMLLRWRSDIAEPNLAASVSPQRDDVEAVLLFLRRKALDEIRSNHGIKEDAFKRLASLAGMAADDHANLLLTSLESFGRGRGDVAHLPPGRVRSLSGPQDEADAAEKLLDQLSEFDDYIETI